MDWRERLLLIFEEADKKFIEREELVRLLVLAILCKEHLFLIGKPGVAKSYVLSTIVGLVENANYFEYLIRHDINIEEIFGGVHMDENGALQRNIENTLLDSHFFFADEVFKGPGKLLNSFLQVMNERTFSVGRNRYELPLVSMFAASNEFPEDEALNPFDDRLLFRYEVPRIKKKDNFIRFSMGDFDQTREFENRIDLEDIEEVQRAAEYIELPVGVATVFESLKQRLLEDNIPVSDRKLGKAVHVFRVSALLNGRGAIDYSDFFLLLHIGWSDFANRLRLYETVFEFFFGTKPGVDATLIEIEKKLSLSEGFIKNDYSMYLNYSENIVGSNKEAVFKKKYVEIAEQYHKCVEYQSILDDIRENYDFTQYVESIIADNIFLRNFNGGTYSPEALQKLHSLADSNGSYIRIMKKWLECTATYSDYDLFQHEAKTQNDTTFNEEAL